MKKDIIEAFQLFVGQDIEDKLMGLGRWINAKLQSINEDGDVVMSILIREDMLNPLGNIHGGSVSAIMDEMMGLQLFIKSDNQIFVATTLYIDFLDKAKAGETLYAHPKTIRIGKSTANVSCELLNEKGKLIARSTSNYAKIGETQLAMTNPDA